MKKKIFKSSVLAVSLFFSTTICFGGEMFQAGGTTFYIDDNGRTATSYQEGGTTFYRDSYGDTATSYEAGGTTFFHYGTPPQKLQDQDRESQELYLEFQRNIAKGGTEGSNK